MPVITAAALAGHASADPDLWGHLRFGLDTIAGAGLTSVDPYSFTQDVPWINHEWLSEVVFALAYRTAGVAGLLVLKLALVVLTAGCLWPIARRAQPSTRWWLLAMSLFALAPTLGTFRPQLWTVLAVALLANVLVERRSPLWLVVMFPIWANLHGGWIVGVGLAGLWSLGQVLDASDIRAARPVGGALVVAIVATLLNPYGWRLWAFLLATVGMSRPITEWRPVWQQDGWGHAAMAAGLLLVTAVAVVRGWRRLSWAALLPVAWLGISGLFVDRLWPLFGEVSLLVTSEAWRARSGVAHTAPAPPAAYLVVDGIVALAVWLSLAVPVSRCLPVRGTWTPDLALAGAFAAPNVTGRLVVPFDWGQYAIWHWGPRLRVSMDGRRETIYSAATEAEQTGLLRGSPASLAFLARERPEYAWLPASANTTLAWLEGHGYRLDLRSPASVIATRGDLPPLASASAAPACFP